jgi:hypothetical protein
MAQVAFVQRCAQIAIKVSGRPTESGASWLAPRNLREQKVTRHRYFFGATTHFFVDVFGV